MLEKGVISEIDEDESAAQFNILIEKAESAGFIQYEISNFGKPDIFQFIIQITGNRSIILDLVHRLTLLTDIHGSGIYVI